MNDFRPPWQGSPTTGITVSSRSPIAKSRRLQTDGWENKAIIEPCHVGSFFDMQEKGYSRLFFSSSVCRVLVLEHCNTIQISGATPDA